MPISNLKRFHAWWIYLIKEGIFVVFKIPDNTELKEFNLKYFARVLIQIRAIEFNYKGWGVITSENGSDEFHVFQNFTNEKYDK